MSISLTVGTGKSISLDSLADLKSGASSLLKLGPEFLPYLAQSVSVLPTNLRTSSLQYSSGNQTWAPGALTFSLSGSVCGKISVLTSGTLLTYTDGFPTTVTLGAPPADNSKSSANISITAPDAYICLELDFKLSGGLTGSYTSGIYGVSTDDSAAGSITIAFYKHCLATDTLEAAITAAFSGFVLPLHPDTLKNLAVKDYLHYTFNASLQLGLGASVGVDKVLYAGQFATDIPGTASAVGISVSAEPEVQAGAKLSFNYDYTGTFEVLLWIDPANTAHLHLYRSSTQDTTLGLNLGITLTTGTAASVNFTPSSLDTAITNRLPSFARTAFQSKVLDPTNTEVNKYVTDVNTKITSWLSPINNQKASLALAIESTQDRFLLTNYSIDLTKNYAPAWKAMNDGRFVDAFDLTGSGVSLDTGSGLENVFTTATSVKLNLFGALTATWTDTLIDNTSLIYAGNNTFHLITNQGRSLLTVINGTSKKEIDVYFAAEADLKNGGSSLEGTNLHVVLQSTDNSSFGASVAGVIGQLTQGPAGLALTASVQALAAKPNTTQLLHLVFTPATYGKKLNASPNPLTGVNDEIADQLNYIAFTDACAQLFGNAQTQNFSYQQTQLNYHMWRQCNIAANDSQAPANALPSRVNSGSYAAGIQWLDAQGLDVMDQMIWQTLNVGCDFMNLCADLKSLASATVSLDTWSDFVARLQKIIKNDVSVDFVPSTALALAKLCGGAPSTVEAPVPNLPPGSSIGITMTY